MISTLSKPIEVVTLGDEHKKVSVYSKGEEHTTSFGYEWTTYSRVQSDAELNANISRSRLELNLGFPLEFLKGMNVLELGCGPGRFTEHFVQHAKSVVAVDLSNAIFHNSALGHRNLLAIKANLMEVPPLSEPIDLVFCRGVIQHTASPQDSLRRLFDYVRPEGLVIFDVYKKEPWHWRSFKYFWRPFFQKYISLEKFDRFITRHVVRLYAIHHASLRVLSTLRPLKWILMKTPLYLSNNWEEEFPNLTIAQKHELFKADLIDALYSHYDQPMTAREVLDTTAAIGQLPYSYDLMRNQFRYKKSDSTESIQARFTKNGALRMLSKNATLRA